MGDGYSLAWRIMDARYHGVPQRRRRITLVVDFAGDCAPKVLFDEDGYRWDFKTSQRAWKGIAPYFKGSPVRSVGGRLGYSKNCLNPNDPQSMRLFSTEGCYQSLSAREKSGVENSGVVYPKFGTGAKEPIAFHLLQDPISGEVAPCLSASSQCTTGVVLDDQGGSQISVRDDDLSPTLRAQTHGHPPCVVGAFLSRQGESAGSIGFEEEISPTIRNSVVPETVYSIDGNVCDRVSKKNGCGYSENVSPTLNTQDRHAVVYDARGNGDGETSPTITGDHPARVTDYTPIAVCGFTEKAYGDYKEGCGPIRSCGGTLGGGSETIGVFVYPETTGSLCANSHPGGYTGQDAYNDMLPVIKNGRKYIVRRLIPLECSRLQGMPDDWCNIPETSEADAKEQVAFWIPFLNEWSAINGKKPKTEKQILKWLTKPVSESAQYQMYGNGIALPQWVWTCGRIIETYKGINPTMASLFDGTGSFPLIWNSILGGPYTVWSSEVNPDAIRVSKYRIDERWCPNEHSNGNPV